MKFGFTPLLFICAVIVGVALSFAFAAFSSPHVVEQPTIVITPVPTPQPVYIQPTAAPQQQTNWKSTDDQSATVIASILPIAVVGVGIMTIILGIFTVGMGRD